MSARQKREAAPPSDDPVVGEVGDTPRPSGRSTGRPPSWSYEACRLWTERYEGIAPGGRIGKALKPLVEQHGAAAVLAAWTRYLVETPAQYANPQGFAAKFGTFAGSRASGLTPGQKARVAALEFLGEEER